MAYLQNIDSIWVTVNFLLETGKPRWLPGAFLMLYIQYSWLGITSRTCVLRLSGKGIRLLGLDKKMGELELTILVYRSRRFSELRLPRLVATNSGVWICSSHFSATSICRDKRVSSHSLSPARWVLRIERGCRDSRCA